MKAIIVGGGQVGSYIANILLASGCDVCVIDERERIISKLEKFLPKESIVAGDGADPIVLEQAGIADADVVAVVTGSDEVNLVVATIAKYEFGVPRVIARVNHPKNAWLFTIEMGVDVKVNQAELMAHLVVDEIDLKNMYTLMKLNRGDYAIVQVRVDAHSKTVNQAVKDLKLPEDMVLIAINRAHKIVIPRGDTIIEAEDSILALSTEHGQAALNTLFG